MADRARDGRPPKPDADALTVLSGALERGLRAYGFPVTIWTLGDLQTLMLRERQVVKVFGFTAVLSYSRLRFLRLITRTDAPTLIRCPVVDFEAFWASCEPCWPIA